MNPDAHPVTGLLNFLATNDGKRKLRLSSESEVATRTVSAFGVLR